MPLAGKRILLGVSGGIAAFKAVELLRLLTRSQATVDVVMTPNTTRFVGAGHAIRRSTFEAVGGYDERLMFCGEEQIGRAHV